MSQSHLPVQTHQLQAAQFRTTHWSVVLAAGEEGGTDQATALEQLCRVYWYPVYAFVRRQGHGPHDAQDLTQEFFAHLLERDTLAAVRQEKGRFRSFLLGALKNHLGYQARKKSALKRGGRAIVVAIDEEESEERFRLDLAHEDTPEKLYLRSWAETLLASTLGLLRQDYEQAGKLALFEKLQPHLSGAAGISYQETGTALGLSAGAVTTSVYRMRQRYGELLRKQIAETVASPAEVDDEISFLFAAVEA